MVSGRGRGGRGEGRMGISGSPSARARALSAAEELERQRRASDMARIHGSYRYLQQGCGPLPAFDRRESRYYRDPQLSSSRRSTSSSRDPPPRCLSFIEASSSSAPPLVPRFNPGDYVDDANIPMLVAKLKHAARALTAGDFIPDSALGAVTALEEKTCREKCGLAPRAGVVLHRALRLRQGVSCS